MNAEEKERIAAVISAAREDMKMKFENTEYGQYKKMEEQRKACYFELLESFAKSRRGKAVGNLIDIIEGTDGRYTCLKKYWNSLSKKVLVKYPGGYILSKAIIASHPRSKVDHTAFPEGYSLVEEVVASYPEGYRLKDQLSAISALGKTKSKKALKYLEKLIERKENSIYLYSTVGQMDMIDNHYNISIRYPNMPHQLQFECEYDCYDSYPPPPVHTPISSIESAIDGLQ